MREAFFDKGTKPYDVQIKGEEDLKKKGGGLKRKPKAGVRIPAQIPETLI